MGGSADDRAGGGGGGGGRPSVIHGLTVRAGRAGRVARAWRVAVRVPGRGRMGVRSWLRVPVWCDLGSSGGRLGKPSRLGQCMGGDADGTAGVAGCAGGGGGCAGVTTCEWPGRRGGALMYIVCYCIARKTQRKSEPAAGRRSPGSRDSYC